MYSPALAFHCYATVRQRPTCTKNRIIIRENVQLLQLFPTTAAVKSVAIEVLSELIQTARGNQYLLIISNRSTKLTNSVPLKTVSASKVAMAFVHK